MLFTTSLDFDMFQYTNDPEKGTLAAMKSFLGYFDLTNLFFDNKDTYCPE